MYRLSPKNVELIAHRLALALLNTPTEPIAPFETCNIDSLEAALNRPFAGNKDEEFYPSTSSKAMALLYSMVKNHPFQNGNKRIATTSLLTFLHINDYWLEVDESKLAEWVLNIAESDSRKSAQVFEDGDKWISERLIACAKSESKVVDFFKRLMNLYRR